MGNTTEPKKKSLRKRVAIATSAVLAAALLLTGTYAWYVSNQALNEFSNSAGQKEALLHDDFDPANPYANKDVYVENTSSSEYIYVRVKLQEYLDLTSSTRPSNLNSLWQTHIPANDNVAVCANDAVNSNQAIHDDFTWTMGGTKYYMPGQSYAKDPTTGALVDYARDNNTYNASTPNALLTDGTDSDPTVITLADYEALSSTEQADYVGWIYDTDGWAYWSQPLAPNTATALLLNKVTSNLGDNTYYYAINAVMEAVNKSDIGMWESGAQSQDGTSSGEKATDPMVPVIKQIVDREPDSSDVTSISVSGTPAKTTYNDGESFDPTGLTLNVTTSSGTSQITLPDASVTISPDPLTTGTTSVTISYGGKTATVDGLTVNPAPAPTVTGIAVATQPTTTTYTDGQSLDPTGLTLTATYSDNTTQTIQGNDPGVTITPNPLTAGTTSVTVTYGGQTATVSGLTVNPAAPGVLPVKTTDYAPNYSGDPAEHAAALNSAVVLDNTATGVLTLDTMDYSGGAVDCYGYIPLSNFVDDTSGVTINSINGNGLNIPVGDGGITIGTGIDLYPFRMSDSSTANVPCLILEYVPNDLLTDQFHVDPNHGGYYHDITITLAQNGNVSAPITLRYLVSGWFNLGTVPNN